MISNVKFINFYLINSFTSETQHIFQDFIYFFEIQQEKESTSGRWGEGAEQEGEAGSPLRREPDAGLNLRTLRA